MDIRFPSFEATGRCKFPLGATHAQSTDRESNQPDPPPSWGTLQLTRVLQRDQCHGNHPPKETEKAHDTKKRLKRHERTLATAMCDPSLVPAGILIRHFEDNSRNGTVKIM